MTRKPDDAEPFSGLAFKIMADPFVGTLTFVRIYRCSMISSNFFLRLCDKGGYHFSILSMHCEELSSRKVATDRCHSWEEAV